MDVCGKFSVKTGKLKKLNRAILLLAFFIFSSTGCKLDDNSVRGSIGDNISTSPDNTTPPPSPPPTPTPKVFKALFSEPLKFTGASDPRSDVNLRIFDENSSPAWRLTGTCSPEHGDVTVTGDLDAPVTTPCDANGYFTLDINYDTTSPYFWFALGYSRKIMASQNGSEPISTLVYKKLSTDSLTVITSVADLTSMTMMVSGVGYVLGRSFDLEQEVGATNNWTPFGSPFYGTFEGDNQTISGMDIVGVSLFRGFFSTIDGAIGKGIVKNVHFFDASVTASSAYSGVLAGRVTASKILNVHAKNSLVNSSSTDVGGLIGEATGVSTISEVSYHGGLDGISNVGGILGQLTGASKLKFATAKSDGTNLFDHDGAGPLGGLAGLISANTSVENSYVIASIGPATTNTGGLIGSINSTATITNTYAATSMSVTGTSGPLFGIYSGTPSNYDQTNSYFKTICPSCDNVWGADISTPNHRLQSSYVGFDFNDIWHSIDGVSLPKLYFEDNWTHEVKEILIKSEPMVPLIPALQGNFSSFSIAPSLPTGLTFDTTYGAIYGTPTVSAPITDYTITATDEDGGTQDIVVRFGVGYQFRVNHTETTSDAATGNGICADGSARCTLRAAIDEANWIYTNESGAPVEVILPAGSFNLFGGSNPGNLIITSNVKIKGAGMSATDINGGSSSNTGALIRLFQNDTQVKIEDLAIKNYTNNMVTLPGGGIQIVMNVDLILNRVHFENLNSINDGGAIASGMNGTTAKIYDSKFINNSSTSNSGGAIFWWSGGELFIENSLFDGNSAGTGSSDSGGAISGAVSFNNFTLKNSTVSNNSAANNGAILAMAGNLLNNTFYSNSSTTAGAVVSVGTDFSGIKSLLQNNTFVNNSSISTGYADLRIENADMGHNIIKAHATTTAHCLITTNVTSLGYNVTELANNCGFDHGTDLDLTDPLVVAGPPAQNGGTVPTILLQSGSPAKDIGGDCSSSDQRYFPRNGACDAGATELQP